MFSPLATAFCEHRSFRLPLHRRVPIISMTPGKYAYSKPRPTRKLRSGALHHRTHARVCACHRSMTAAFIIRDVICRAFGAVRNGIPPTNEVRWGPRSCDAQKGPQKSPLRESLSGNRSRCLWTTQSHFLARVPRIYPDFFDIMDILGCPWTLLDGGPARTRLPEASH